MFGLGINYLASARAAKAQADTAAAYREHVILSQRAWWEERCRIKAMPRKATNLRKLMSLPSTGERHNANRTN